MIHFITIGNQSTITIMNTIKNQDSEQLVNKIVVKKTTN